MRLRGGGTTTDQAGGEGLRVAVWNAERLDAKGLGGGSVCSAECRDKRRWIEEYIDGAEPDVIGILEVIANLKQLRVIRKWLRPRGYEAALLAGEGGSRREPGVFTSTNAIIVAVRRSTVQLVSYGRRAERVIGVEVRVKAERRLQRVCFMHGLHGTVKSAGDVPGEHPVRSFPHQLLQAKAWLAEKGGGLLLGDMNKVPCRSWRCSGCDLTGDDRILRAQAGWRCTCCQEEGEQVESDAEIVGGAGAALGVHHTHLRRTFDLSSGHGCAAESRLDYVVAVGTDVSAWSLGRQLRSERDNGRLIADHELVEANRKPQVDMGGGASRRMPIRMGKDGLGVVIKRTYGDIVCASRWQNEAAAKCAEAAGAGGSVVEPLAAGMRAAGEEALRLARDECGMKQRQGQNASGDYNSWTKRLDKARELRSRGASPFAWDALLFHARTGLVDTRNRAARRCGSWDNIWERIIRRCRQQTRRAGRRRTRTGPAAEDRRAVECARQAPSDAEGAKNAALRLIKGTSVHAPMEMVYPGDDVSRAPISCNTPEGREEMGRIGKQFVQSMDEDPNVEAFQAWCDIFLEQMPTLRGSDGDTWVLRKELTFELFEEVLRRMPKRKGVGASGWSVELLLEADANLRRMFYEAIMADLAGGTIADSWRRVLYVLLVKPAPNDARRVSERREIALMAQEMKLLLQMVRRVSYARIVGRLAKEQAGWLAGFGATDPAVTAALVIQQARRLGHPLWLLYVDLATFFPKINREVVAVAELVHGLPPEVVEIATLIYGTHDGSQAAVRCQYDSAGGLSGEFENYMGALMGCVLSPDKAKVLLNSVLVAIQVVCKGVRLWGYGTAEQERVWRAILQMCYADDHLAACTTVGELRKVWAVWQCWELVSGCKLGIKRKAKTVVTGVAYDVQGRPVAVDDPKLEHRDGSLVPYMRHDEAYKHLGIPRRADGVDDAAWKGVKRKFEGALRRLRKLNVPRNVSLDEFVEVSNMLLGGIANYYLQAMYITWAQAEFIERKWRAIYNRNAARCRSAPRVQLYTPVRAAGGYKGATGRAHIYALGLSAVYSAVGKALGDIEDTSQRAATRSAFALALETWGCRANPLTWRWDEWAAEIEHALEESPVKYLADAYLLACCRLNDVRDGPTCKWVVGKCSGLENGPLDATGAHFRHGGTPLLFEPVEAGGVGLRRTRWLVQAGVVEVGHFCAAARKEVSAREGGEWIRDYAEARKLNPRLAECGAAREAWETARANLVATGVRPTARVTVPSRLAHWSRQQRMDAPWTSQSAEEQGDSVDLAAVRRLVGRLRRDKSEALPFGRKEWGMQLRKCFPSASATGSAEWKHGGREHDVQAVGARLLAVLDDSRNPSASGGEHRWMRREDVGDDGFLLGWRLRERELRAEIYFDEEGWPEWPSGLPVQEDEFHMLSPAAQLQCRARFALGADVPLHRAWGGAVVKRTGTHVHLDVQQANKAELAMWSARVAPTAVYATDGTKQICKDEDGKVKYSSVTHGPMHVIARAAVRHDGTVVGGAFDERDGANTYVAELAALIEALQAESDGGRIIIVFDATSPVRAALKYGRVHARRKGCHYASEMLDTLLQEARRHELVLFVWQRSHVGSPVNEWADTAADTMAKNCSDPSQGDGVTPLACAASEAFSMADGRWLRGPFRWSGPAAQRFVLSRLRETVKNTELPDVEDLEYGALSGHQRSVLDAVLSRRAQIGDARRYTGKAAQAAAAAAGCPAGCKHADGTLCKLTYDHAAFYCKHPELTVLRQRWAEELMNLRGLIEKDGVPDKPLLNAMRLLRPMKFPTSRNAYGVPRGDMCLACDDDEQRDIERELRRVVGGRYHKPSADAKCSAGTLHAAAREAAAAGALVQTAARRLSADTADSIRTMGREHALARKYGRRWRSRVLAGGPERVAALAHVDDVRHRMLAMIEGLPASRWKAAVARLRTAIATEAAAAKMRHTRHRRDLATAWWLGWRCHRWRGWALANHILDEVAALHAIQRMATGWRRTKLVTAAHTRQLGDGAEGCDAAQARAMAQRDARARACRKRGGFGTLKTAWQREWGEALDVERGELIEFTQRLTRRSRADLGRYAARNPAEVEQGCRQTVTTDVLASKVAEAVFLKPMDISARGAAVNDVRRQTARRWYTNGCCCAAKVASCSCGAVSLGVASHVPGAESRVLRSFKGWLMAGGMPEVRRERRGETHLRKQIAVLRQAASFARYFKSKHGSCSGAPLEPVGERIEWTRAKRRKVQQPRERATLNVLVAKGRAADQSNRFACSLWRVSFKRGKRGKRGPLMALVRWKDDRWWPSWKRAFAPAGQPEGLSAELRDEARALRGAWLRGRACRSGCVPRNAQPTPRDGQRRSDRLTSGGEAKGSDARDTENSLRGCEIDDDEDLTIDQWLALDGEGPMSESESGSEAEDDDSSSESSSDENMQDGTGQDAAYDAVRVRGVRRRGQLQALIEWSGNDSNGVPWKHSWEPVQDVGPGLQQEAQAMWERTKARRRGKGKRSDPKSESAQPDHGTVRRAASVAARQRTERAARASRGRKSGDGKGSSGPTTRKRSRGDGN